jgi:hypothetical protein
MIDNIVISFWVRPDKDFNS